MEGPETEGKGKEGVGREERGLVREKKVLAEREGRRWGGEKEVEKGN